MENSEGNLVNLERRDSKYKQLIKGILEKLLHQFCVWSFQASRIWHAAQTQYREDKICGYVFSKKKERCERNPKDY